MKINSKITKKFLLTIIIIYSTMLIFGLMENIKGVSFSLIKDEFAASYNAQGGLVSFSWFGYVFFCIVATFSLEKYGAKRSLLFGYNFVALGCILVFFSNSFFIASLALMVLWMGFGFFEVGNNAIATTTFTSNSAIFLNLMHFFYGLGAVLGPIFASSITNTFNTSYRGIYLVSLIPVLILLVLIIFSKSNMNSNSEDEKGTMTIKTALKNKYVWFFSIALGFLEVIEFAAANWGSFYLRDAFGLDPLTIGATFVSSYYIGFTISRLFSGFVIEKIGYIKSIVLSLITLFILFVLGFSLGTSGIALLSLTGFFIAIMWPTTMCIAMKLFKEDTAIATSVIIVLSGTINGLMQYLTGFINEFIGSLWGYRLSTIYVFVPLLIFAFIINKKVKSNLLINN